MLPQERQDLVRELAALAQEPGFVTLDQVLERVSGDLDADDLSSLLQEMESQGVEVEGATATHQAEVQTPPRRRRPVSRVTWEPEVHPVGDEADQGQDLVRTYLRQMSRVPLLTREGEVAIAKRIGTWRKPGDDRVVAEFDRCAASRGSGPGAARG